MIPRWSRGGRGDDRTGAREGRSPTGRVVDDTIGRSLCELQDVRFTHYRRLRYRAFAGRTLGRVAGVRLHARWRVELERGIS